MSGRQDFLAADLDDAARCALSHLREMTPFCRVLGSYPRDSTLVGPISDTLRDLAEGRSNAYKVCQEYRATGFSRDKFQSVAARSLCLVSSRKLCWLSYVYPELYDFTPFCSFPLRKQDEKEAASAIRAPSMPLREMGRRGTTSTKRLKIGVIGFGKFGQFMARTFTKNHEVLGMGRGDYSAVSREMGALHILFVCMYGCIYQIAHCITAQFCPVIPINSHTMLLALVLFILIILSQGKCVCVCVK